MIETVQPQDNKTTRQINNKTARQIKNMATQQQESTKTRQHNTTIGQQNNETIQHTNKRCRQQCTINIYQQISTYNIVYTINQNFTSFLFLLRFNNHETYLLQKTCSITSAGASELMISFEN